MSAMWHCVVCRVRRKKFQIPMILLCNSNFFLCGGTSSSWYSNHLSPNLPPTSTTRAWLVYSLTSGHTTRKLHRKKFASSFFFFFFPYSMQFRAIKDTTSGSPYNWNNSNHLLLSVALSLFKYNESQLLCITLCLSTLRGRKLGS